MLDAVEEAEASVRKSDEVIRGTLRVATPPMLDPSFNALVCDFARTYPEVQIVHQSLHLEGSLLP